MIYNLDLNEEIDTIIINGQEYKVGDIPIGIMEKIQNIKTGFFRKNFIDQWKPIIEEILKIRNKDFEIKNLTNEKIFNFINLINIKMEKGAIK